MKLHCLVATLLLIFSTAAWSDDLNTCPGGQATTSQRYLAVISDHHIGNGRRDDGKWHRTEDFRWDNALRVFLDRMTHCSGGRADLVIAGDLLELWQPLPQLHCKNKEGCTVDEMVAITTNVLKGHPDTWVILRDFADKADNRIHVIPGNHDAALLLPEVWRVFHDALDASPGRVRLVQNGLWVSDDGLVLVEHGHQIGSDVNRYDTWPQILRSSNGQQLIVQPWGENFVQSIFNEEEETYPIIDNLSPEAAGARYRMADRGKWRTAKDMARFLAFNLFETSFQQKTASLGESEQAAPEWNLELGREMGHLLFANALAADDPFRQVLLGKSLAAAALRAELDELARDQNRTSNAEIELLCDQIAIRQVTQQCAETHLGALLEKLLVPRKQVMRDHLESRIAQPGLEKVRVFIYGHTHLLEEAWNLDLDPFIRMTVLNSGAFQRVVDEAGFLARVNTKPGLTPSKALGVFQPEDLAPCYTAVLVPPYEKNTPLPQTVQWYADENAKGQFVTTDDARCR